MASAINEVDEHMEGMKEAYIELQKRSLRIHAFAVDNGRAPATAKTVHFVRHGQGFHNFVANLAASSGIQWKQFSNTAANPYIKPEILDAPLTDVGRQQALGLQSAVHALLHRPQLVVCSPNCRALQTASLAFESLIGSAPFLAHEMVREETGVHVCDKRRSTSRQRAEFPHIDFSLLSSEQDPLFRDDIRETKLEVGNRIYDFMEWLMDRPEQHVVVSSHSAWLLTLFNAVVSDTCDHTLKQWFQTGEMRSARLHFVRR